MFTVVASDYLSMPVQWSSHIVADAPLTSWQHVILIRILSFEFHKAFAPVHSDVNSWQSCCKKKWRSQSVANVVCSPKMSIEMFDWQGCCNDRGLPAITVCVFPGIERGFRIVYQDSALFFLLNIGVPWFFIHGHFILAQVSNMSHSWIITGDWFGYPLL